VIGSATDPGSRDALVYSWKVFKVGVAAPVASDIGATSFDFTPDNDGDYRIELTVVDDDGLSASVEQMITVANVAPVATSLSASRGEDMFLPVKLTASDVPADTLSYSIPAQPLHGMLLGTLPNVFYVPVRDYNGNDQFTYQANDGLADSNEATVTLTILPRNDRPSFQKGANEVAADNSGPQSVAWAT